LVPKIQEAVAAGTMPVSQGYIFAANIENPDFLTIFDAIMETPVNNTKLQQMLTEYKKIKPEPASQKLMPIKKRIAVLQNAKSYFEKNTGMYAKSDIQTFLDELKVLLSFMEEQLQAAPEKATVKKPGKQPSVSV
jgi:hypothetical protein